jgi:hypothetical protein
MLVIWEQYYCDTLHFYCPIQGNYAIHLVVSLTRLLIVKHIPFADSPPRVNLHIFANFDELKL